MKWKHLGRTLLSLLLVCVLLVNISPIRAEASAVGVPTVIGATIAVGSILYGLGFRYAHDYDYFVGGLEYWALALASYTDFISPEGLATVVSLGSGTYGVSFAFVQACRDLLWNQGMLQERSSFAENITEYQIGNATVELSDTVPSAVFVTVGDWQDINADTWYVLNVATCEGEFPCPYFGVSGDLYTSSYYSRDFSVTVGGTYHRIRGINVQGYTGSYYTYSNDEELKSLAASLISDSTEVVAADGFALDFVAKPSLSLAEGYPEWAANSVVIDDETYYPIVVAPSIEEMKDVKQEDVWVGIVFEDTGVTEPSQPNDEEDPIYPMDPNYTTLIERLFGNVSDKIEYVAYSIQEIPEILREFMQDVKEGLERLPGQFKEWFDDIRTKLQQLVTGQITLADLLAGLFQPVRDAIVDALTYLFAPGEAFIKTQVESLIAKYPTSNNLFNLGTRLSDFLLNLGQTPPVIYIDLGAAEGSYLLGGTVAFLDLTWYSRYKGTVDGILGGFLWLLFAWRVWLKLPGILGGASGTVGSILHTREEMNDN